ncbi:hypothetical protein FRC14_000393 [Serendipita sp. 396]|nr:hypothetical protein FRC14_000393 [Serendipita sp. 396]
MSHIYTGATRQRCLVPSRPTLPSHQSTTIAAEKVALWSGLNRTYITCGGALAVLDIRSVTLSRSNTGPPNSYWHSGIEDEFEFSPRPVRHLTRLRYCKVHL